MLSTFLNFISRLYNGIISVFISALLGVSLWVCWGFYREAALESRFHREARPITVTVEQTSFQSRSWRDELANVAYLTFRYRQQPYTARFVLDTVSVEEGDRVTLLYHPELDIFRQPGQHFHFKESQGVSRLVNWSVLIGFSPERKLLVLCGVLGIAFFIVASGTVANITGWSFPPAVSYLLLVLLLLGGTAFLTYSSWQYVQYYGRLKAHGRQTEVTVLSTDRSSYYSRGSRYGKSYRYKAKVQFEGRERIIPLEEDAYEELRPGNSLPVLYDSSLDDLMPVDYSMDHREFYLLGIAWLVTLYFARRKLTRRVKKAQPNLS